MRTGEEDCRYGTRGDWRKDGYLKGRSRLSETNAVMLGGEWDHDGMKGGEGNAEGLGGD